MSKTFASQKSAAKIEARRIDVSDLQSRCAAAARMALRGQNWSAEDRADCAADLVCRVWADVVESNRIGSRAGQVRSSVKSGDRVTYTKKSPQKSKDTVGTDARITTIPAELATFTRLYGLASNYRRGVERQRDRDMADALLNAERAESFVPYVEAPASETGGTPWGARRTALELLRTIGLLGESEAPHWGPLWTLAYSAARAIESAEDGIGRAEIAEELELSAETLRQHLSRAVARIPAAGVHTRAQWADALYVPLGGVALKPSRSRTLSADMGTRHNGPRDYVKPEDHAPVESRRDGRIIRRTDRLSDWGKALKTGTPAQRRTAARLETATAIRRGKVAR